MKKSILKNIILMMLLFLSIFSSSNIVFATGDQSVSGIIEGGSSFINDGEKQTSPITTDKTQELTNDLYNILFFCLFQYIFIVFRLFHQRLHRYWRVRLNSKPKMGFVGQNYHYTQGKQI